MGEDYVKISLDEWKRIKRAVAAVSSDAKALRKLDGPRPLVEHLCSVARDLEEYTSD